MCGIFVAIHKNSTIDESTSILYQRATSLLKFRGPDLQITSHFNNSVFLGQTILSLTGNITNQHGEHLESKSGRYKISFNGEIYNYLNLHNKYQTYLSESNEQKLTDTEVLVNLFDQFRIPEVNNLIDGMYAYCVLDKTENSLLFARDPQGEKSLYIYEDENVIFVSSEIKAILTLQKDLQIDTQVLKDYFTTRHFMFQERTTFKNIRQLKPGMTLSYDLKNNSWKEVHELKMSSWINPVTYAKNKNRSLEDLTDELETLIDNACKEMIPVNRNFASVVSGGVDSSLLSSFVMKHGKPSLLLAVNHVGKDNISHDLLGFQKALGKEINIINVDKIVYAQALIQCQKVLSGPVFSHSFVGQSLQSQFARANGCQAMFGGEGADELFGGYNAYLETSRRVKNSKYSNSPYSGYSPLIKFESNNHEIIEKELSDLWKEALKAYDFLEDQDEKITQAMMYCDLSYQLPAVGLRSADLMSMMWSIETRSIFMRRDIIKFALNLPLEFKIDSNASDPMLATKKILKNLFLRKFPRELLVEKQGFSGFPNEAGAFLGEIKNFTSLKFLGLNEDNVSAAVSAALLWKLINVEFFLREHL